MIIFKEFLDAVMKTLMVVIKGLTGSGILWNLLPKHPGAHRF